MHALAKKTLVPVLLVGLAIRIFLPLALGKNPKQGDGDEYFRYAYHLYHSGIYSDEIGEHVHATAGKMPGTPLLIYSAMLVLGEDSKLLILPNIIFSLLTLLIVFLFIKKLKTDSLLSLSLFSAFAFIPVVDFYSGQFYPEVPATFFTVWGFYLVYAYFSNKLFTKWLLASASFSVACFFRPELAFTGFVITGFSILLHSSVREKMKMAISFPLCFIFLLTPWMVRNFISTGNTSPMGENFLIEKTDGGSRPEHCAQGLYAWLNTWHYTEKHVKSIAWDFPGADLDALPDFAFSDPQEKATIHSLQPGGYDCIKDSTLKSIALAKIKEDPFKYYFILPLKRMFFLLFRVERYDTFESQSIPTWALSFAWWLFALWSGRLGFWGLLSSLFLWKNNFWTRIVLTSILLRLVFFAWFYHVESRYMLIFLPVHLMIILVFIQLRYDNHRGSTTSR